MLEKTIEQTNNYKITSKMTTVRCYSIWWDRWVEVAVENN